MFPLRVLRRLFSRKRKSPKRMVKKRMVKRVAKVNRSLLVKKTIDLGYTSQACGTAGAPAISYGARTFQLTDFPQGTNYANLYDKYRIKKIVIRIKSTSNAGPTYANPGQITTAGFIHSMIDTTDSIISGIALQDFMNDSTYKCTPSTRDHVRIIYPKFLVDVGGNNASDSKSGWLNTRDVSNSLSAVSHYGLKLAYQGGIAATAGYTSFIFDTFITYYVEFKDPK